MHTRQLGYQHSNKTTHPSLVQDGGQTYIQQRVERDRPSIPAGPCVLLPIP